MYKEERQLRAIGFSRVASSDKRTELNLAEQNEIIGRFMVKANLNCDNNFDDVDNSCEGLQDAYDYCKEDNDICYLVITDFVRISRNAKELIAWIRKFEQLGVEVIEAMHKSLDFYFGEVEEYVPHLISEWS